MLWIFLFNPGRGLITHVLEQFGYNWNHAQNSGQAMFLVVFASIWKQISYNFLFFFAALQSIPRSLVEAAAIDGAGPIRRFFKLSLPLIAPVSFFLLVVSLVYAFFDTFPVIMSLVGLAVIIGLEKLKVPGGILLTIIGISIVGLIFDPNVHFSGVFAMPSLSDENGNSLIGSLDIMGALNPVVLPSVLALVMTAVFDATGTIRAVAGQAKDLQRGVTARDRDRRVARRVDRGLGVRFGIPDVAEGEDKSAFAAFEQPPDGSERAEPFRTGERAVGHKRIICGVRQDGVRGSSWPACAVGCG